MLKDCHQAIRKAGSSRKEASRKEKKVSQAFCLLVILSSLALMAGNDLIKGLHL